MLRIPTDPDIVGPAGPEGIFTADIDHCALAHFNHERLVPGLGKRQSAAERSRSELVLAFEEQFLCQALAEISPLAADVPADSRGFISWFGQLSQTGPGQNDPLFPWLATQATYEEMRWFLEQEVAGEAGFDDLVAMTQVKMPVRPKLEMARNYWDEMGRGDPKGMHGPMLEDLAAHLNIKTRIDTTVTEALALGNMMVALATRRAFAFHSVGALGAIEMTAPGRAVLVTQGLNRLGIPKKQSHYFALHSVLDIKHSVAWNAEVLCPLVDEDPRRARAMAEGALLRLWCGQRCFDSYRKHFDLEERMQQRSH